MDPVSEHLKAYLLEAFLPDANPEELTPTTPLVSGGILDSLATVRLAMHLEERFGVEIHAHELTAENLETLERIADLVRRKQAQPGQPPTPEGGA